ncbi:flagellar hook-length control protein FliK [Ruminiclostridium herbifermentans]|uniref:Flagellar hook-length control protein FliK n=1 Tax=Ruminiclostridium herbifermentans TaxID=2488810 RepID=A0A4U7JIH1_9FIRM|nr:flagellar hook-length control protein FliK [Ruminiclostridium herbifermentans]QNU65352.1 flagellar hook-length control protein FliK [Ruminiclostridium herbifermentans]
MRVDGLVPAVGIIQNTGGDILSKLKPGDNVRAQVLENSGSELSLKLSDGSTVLASAMTPVDASEGEYVNFVFRGIVDGKPALEVTNRNIQPQVDSALENIKNTLKGLNLPVTDKNIELAQALQKQNLPVNAENMSKAMSLLSNNTQLKANSAAFLTAANMSDNQSIEKLQNLLAGRLKISNDIGDLLKLINSDGKNSANTVNQNIVNDILGKLTAEMAAKNQINNNISSNSTAASLNEVANAVKTMSSNSSSMTANNAAVTANGSSSASGAEVTNNVNTAADRIQNASDNAKTAVNNAANNSKAESNISNNLQGNTAINNNTANLKEALNSTKGIDNNVNGAAEGKAAIQQSDNSLNINNKGSISHIEQQISNLLKGGESLGKGDLTALNQLNSRLESLINSGQLSAEELSASKQIAKEINSAIFRIQGGDTAFDQLSMEAKSIKSFEETVNKLQNLFIKIDQSSDEINPVKLYKSMDDAIQAIKTSILQLPASMQQTATNIVGNLESNINFINQLNNYSSYVQIPLSIFNQNTTGELYMLKRGSKSKKLDASNMTVLISLDSNNIGRIDTLLSVDKKNISTNFRVENSEVFDVLKEHHKMLYTSLLEKGFRLVDFTYRLLEEPLSIVNFEEEAKKEFIKNPNNIDVLI